MGARSALTQSMVLSDAAGMNIKHNKPNLYGFFLVLFVYIANAKYSLLCATLPRQEKSPRRTMNSGFHCL